MHCFSSGLGMEKTLEHTHCLDLTMVSPFLNKCIPLRLWFPVQSCQENAEVGSRMEVEARCTLGPSRAASLNKRLSYSPLIGVLDNQTGVRS